MRRFLPSLSALVAFEAAARHVSFTRAAEDLAITQSGISRQVSNLEAFLGVKLFERIGSRLILTDAGSAFLREVSGSLDRIEQAAIDTVRGRTLEDALVVCTHPTLASRWLAPRLEDFLRGHPDGVVDVVTATDDIDFDATRIDVAILRGSGSWSHALAFELFPEELVVVAAPRLLPPGPTRDHLDFAAVPTLQNASRPDLWLTWLWASGVSHSGAIRGVRLPQSEMLISAAVAGLGLAVVPAPYVEAELARGDLWLPFGGPVATRDSYWIVHSERRTTVESAMQFRAWLQRQARQRPRPAGDAPGPAAA
ncbi:LysR substrate-binding domain-containing protein [Segnochrobactraceae bacterium EtOH-i3]